MEILKSKISPNHDNASFYTGVIAYGRARNNKVYVLHSESEAEISLFGENEFELKNINEGVIDGVSEGVKHCYASEIEQLGLSMLIDDDSLEDHNCEGVSVLVDGWLIISEARGNSLESILYNGDQNENRIFGFYSEAIEGFETFLNK